MEVLILVTEFLRKPSSIISEGDSGDDFSFVPLRNNHDEDVEKLPVEGDPGVTGNKRRLKIRINWTAAAAAVLQSSLSSSLPLSHNLIVMITNVIKPSSFLQR